MQVEAEVVRNSRNKILQTWEQPYRDSLYNLIFTFTSDRITHQIMRQRAQHMRHVQDLKEVPLPDVQQGYRERLQHRLGRDDEGAEASDRVHDSRVRLLR